METDYSWTNTKSSIVDLINQFHGYLTHEILFIEIDVMIYPVYTTAFWIFLLNFFARIYKSIVIVGYWYLLA